MLTEEFSAPSLRGHPSAELNIIDNRLSSGLLAEMTNPNLLQQLCPRFHKRFSAMPIFGGLANAFLQWLNERNYAHSSLRNHLRAARELSRWLLCRRITSLEALDPHQLAIAHEDFLRRKPSAGGIRALCLFLREHSAIREGRPARPSPSQIELALLSTYLREARGLAENTILGHQRRLRAFLEFVRLDRCPDALSRLNLCQIEAFLKRAAQTNNRFSLQHIVATLRTFLKFKHAQRVVAKPLHQQIDTPRVYRLENLPRALPWSQVQALMRSIDRSEPHGRRDFTMLYLAAAYGLRSGELVRLTLEDIDWRGETLRVPQSKTRRSLRLPLTDEAARVLIEYLRGSARIGEFRELFLRQRAPSGPLKATAVHDVLEKHAKASGLNLPQIGCHVLRHSFAVHLLRRNVSMKAIGDTLGHRDPQSTGIYLRLALDDLRKVGLPIPKGVTSPVRLKPVSRRQLSRVRVQSGTRPEPAGDFISRLSRALRGYLDLKRALGRCFTIEAAVLRNWDRFLHRQFRRMDMIRPEMFHDWAPGLGHLTPTVRRNHLRIVRNFLLFHARSYPTTFIPDPLTFPKPAPPNPPRLVSVTEMARVLEAARQLEPSNYNPLRAQTAHMAFVLLFCCGLRRGELLRLKLRDFDSIEQLLRIEGTKFHKSRLVPLSKSVCAELNGYLKERRARNLAILPDCFLIWSGRRPDPDGGYTAQGLMGIWGQVCLSAEVLDSRGRRPRLHDLRHSFAVAALQRWYAGAVDVQTRLPHLAAYLGHVSPVSTHYYLHLTPELCAAASECFHKRFGCMLTTGGVI